MYYKHLNKYHYLYRLMFVFDENWSFTSHIEKLSIAYSNAYYIYVIEPGKDDLTKVVLTPNSNEYGDIRTKVDKSYLERRLAKRVTNEYNVYGKTFIKYYLLDDPMELKTVVDAIQANHLNVIAMNAKKEKLKRAIESYEKCIKDLKSQISSIDHKIKTYHDENPLPEGVSIT